MDKQGKFEYWIIVNKTEDKILNYSGMWSELFINIKKYKNEQLAEIDAERVGGVIKRYVGSYVIADMEREHNEEK